MADDGGKRCSTRLARCGDDCIATLDVVLSGSRRYKGYARLSHENNPRILLYIPGHLVTVLFYTTIFPSVDTWDSQRPHPLIGGVPLRVQHP